MPFIIVQVGRPQATPASPAGLPRAISRQDRQFLVENGRRAGRWPGYRGKSALPLSASPGALGGLRGLVHPRMILGNIGMVVLPGTLSIRAAHEVFAEDGSLQDARQQARVEQLGGELAANVRWTASGVATMSGGSSSEGS